MDLGTSLRHTLNLSTENKLWKSERDTNIRIKIQYSKSNEDNVAGKSRSGIGRQTETNQRLDVCERANIIRMERATAKWGKKKQKTKM